MNGEALAVKQGIPIDKQIAMLCTVAEQNRSLLCVPEDRCGLVNHETEAVSLGGEERDREVHSMTTRHQ